MQFSLPTGGEVYNSMLPKIIWLYWNTGEKGQPETVRHCIRSWRERNPEWSLRVLDDRSVSEYIDIDELDILRRRDITIQKKANIIRINVLAKYGGVWSDTTCLCIEPLDNWIYECCTAGFFAFKDPGRDRIVANWFMASHDESYLLRHFTEEHNKLWRSNRFRNQRNKYAQSVIKNLKGFLNKNPQKKAYWSSPFFTKILQAYPYFIFHYHFERVIYNDRDCLIIWQNVPYMSADGPHRLRRIGLTTQVTPKLIKEIETAFPPIYKLDWRVSPSKNRTSVLSYALNRWT